MMNKALYPGSFDPPTWGHVHLIRRAAKICEKLYVGIGKNLKKGEGLLTTQEKIEGLKTVISDLHNVEIVVISGLVTDFAREKQIEVLLKGLRFPSDMEYEMQMARANYKLTGIETLFLLAEGETAAISSTLIRELASNQAPLDAFIPQFFEDLLHKRMKKNGTW